ncbi:LOW QUALITY PROTEIN: protein CASC3 [Salarias fasciatus]|uniref:LOW QUALITY PROTEIN: protein CASC3 n=1 Tax=Salarias fasciatus TaxID=181472 RepID=UPI001176A4E1|nr:LOW QUALITY PROTEIN: protein CASC3 [Salarias fasciatus]
MADRRRRRRRASQDSEDDDESGSGSDSGRSGSPSTKARGREPDPVEPVDRARTEAKSDVESECESEDGVGEAVLSDYDSADPEENASHSEGGEEEEEEEEAERYADEEVPAAADQPAQPAADELTEQPEEQQDGGGEEEEEEEEEGGGGGEEEEGGHKEEGKAEEKGNLAGERQSGDGQESTDDPETKAGGRQQLDDDEDRKNPAYIPRKGLFFEHDVRGHPQEEERPKGRNRKLWKDEGRWEHDKFREEEQAPKSREELIAIYGYDIRNGGGPGERTYRQRRPRQSSSPGRDKRWRDGGGGGGERPVRSWHSSGGGGFNRGGAPPPSSIPPSSSLPPAAPQRSGNPSRPPPTRSRPPHQGQVHLPPASQYRNVETNAPHMHSRERPGPKGPPEPDRGVSGRGGRGGAAGRGGPPVVIEDISVSPGGAVEPEQTAAPQPGGYSSASPRRQQDQRGERPASSDSAPQPSATNREASPPTERPVERKSYSLARRTRSRPADLGSKQASVEESAAPSSSGGKNWPAGDGGSQPGGGGGGGGGSNGSGSGGALTDLDQDVARLSLSGGQNWSPNPTNFMRSELRGLPNPLHLPGAPPQFSSMEEMNVASGRAKRYSSQRQRTVPEPAPPLHLGVMEGHYYEPMSYQGPIYTHGEGPAPLPPQGMLVQPEMHLPHPGLHPHQSPAGPIANPALYGGPPVSLSPGQPQQLLPPPFYPPPGVMTFPYPTMYPNPQGQSGQVTYGGVTYYDTVQQQAQPKPSPPRRTSQPVTVKPPPPEVPYASE